MQCIKVFFNAKIRKNSHFLVIPISLKDTSTTNFTSRITYKKIDGAVATVMALDRAIRCENDNVELIYDARGLIFIWAYITIFLVNSIIKYGKYLINT